MEKYNKLNKIGEGASGTVYKCELIQYKETNYLKTNENFFALKKMKISNSVEGISQETIREILSLKKLNHPGIIKINEIFSKK